MKHYFLSSRWVFGLVLGTTLLGGCANNGLGGQSAPTPTTAAQPSPSPIAGGRETVTGTILELVAQNRPLDCTFATETEDNTINGQAKISGQNFRVDAAVASKTTDSRTQIHLVNDGQYVYQWSDLSSSGFKAEPDALLEVGQEIAGNEQAMNQTQVWQALNQEVNYQCAEWTVDQAQFQAPADITFTDITSFLRNLNPNP